MEALLNNWPWFAVITYLIVKDVVPKVLPEVFKSRQSTQDRLFGLLERNIDTTQKLTSTLAKLEQSIGDLAQVVHNVDERVGRIEIVLGK